ncbi:MAG: hypothetical protein AAFX81_17790 [Pseudomonadota bacterium]
MAVLVALLCLAGTSAVSAQQIATPDCARLHPIPGALGYAERDDARRCEGFFQAPVGTAALEVVFFLTGEISFDADQHDGLIVAAPTSLPDATEGLSIAGVTLSHQTYYRMDATIPGDGALRWPIDVVLAPAGIGASDIGVYGWLAGPSSPVFVPVSVTAVPTEADPSAEPASAAAGPTSLGLRAMTELERVTWRPRDESGPLAEWAELAPTSVFAGDLLRLELPPGPSGLVDLEFAALRAATGEWLRRDLTVWRQAP